MKDSILDITRKLANEFTLTRGIEPDALLVPVSRLQLFVDACMVANPAVDGDALLRSLQSDERKLHMNGMWVLASATAPDLMAVNLAGDTPQDDIDEVIFQSVYSGRGQE